MRWKAGPDTTPVADAATTVPTVANGGVTDGGKVYTFHYAMCTLYRFSVRIRAKCKNR
jgi:hypothetical protein